MCNIIAKVFLNRYIWRKIIEFTGLSDDYKYKIIYEIVVSLCNALKDVRFNDETINDIVGIMYDNEYYMFILPLDINKLYYYIINKFYSVASDWFLYLDELSECTYDYDDGIMYFTPPDIKVSTDIRYKEKINKSKDIYNIFNIIFNNKININFWLHFLSLDPDQTLFILLRGLTYKRILI
jgi:hypothetical protein